MIAHRTIPAYAIVMLCGFLPCICPAWASADEIGLDTQMPFDAPEAGDQNGWQLDASAGTAIIGGQYGGIAVGDTKGWAQIFCNNPSTGWGYQATLTSSDPNLFNNDQFGYGVAIDQGVAVVSALQNNTVYVFRGSGATWTEDTMEGLSMPSATHKHFGRDVGVSNIGNERIIVGSGIPVSSDGEAYVYTVEYDEELEAEAWVGESLPAANKTSFGSSVAISGDNAIVGASGIDTAYLYRFTGSEWSPAGTFAKSGGSFGSSVRISGDYAIVGDPTADLAVIYHRDGGTWSEEATLTASDGFGGDQFGYSVDIGENYAIVGASAAWSEDLGSLCGASYVFQRDGSTWTEIEKLVPQDGDWGDEFGSAVAIDDGGDGTGDFIVGAWAHDYNDNDEYNENIGTAYVHQRDALKQWMPGDANRDDKVDATDASILAANWLDDTDVGWGDGDFNTDGIVDDADATLMATNWHYGVGASVPEPATLLLMALGGLCLLLVRTRRRR